VDKVNHRAIFRFLLVYLLLFLPLHVAAQDPVFQFPEAEIEEVTPEMMQNDDRIIYIQDRWSFMPGDNPDWALADYDHSSWNLVSTNLSETDLAFVDWEGFGWFRKQFKVHPDLRGKPLALLVQRHLGASEIYLNGEKIHELGSFSTEVDEVETYNSNNPMVIVFPDQEIHTLAVRFINPDYAETSQMMGFNGFRFLFGDWETHQSNRLRFLSDWTGTNMFYLGALLAIALIHLLLFIFYPAEKRNLYFALFAAFLAALTYLLFKVELIENTTDTMLFLRFLIVVEVLVLTFAARFTHSIDKQITPIYSNAMLVVGIGVAVLMWFYPTGLTWLRELVVLLFLVEILRTIVVMFYKNRKGAWILGMGILIYVFSLIYNVMVNFDVIRGSVQLANMAGSGFLVLSMSVFLSRDFAITQRRLQQKLKEVRQLSKRSLEQERINKEREIEKRLLEAENERKTTELEEARALQFSMLPKTLPNMNGLEMDVFMETATEVGGDYYDYSVGSDGELVLAIGDATGHGMKAGIMVAAAKSYFHTLVHDTDHLSMLQRISGGLRNMDMKMMYMGLTVAEIKGRRLRMAAAGMPPVLRFCCSKACVERITLKGLPLGSQVEYPYQEQEVQLNTGDVVLMMSDGLSELFNSEREMLGLEKIESVLKKCNGLKASDIVQKIQDLIDQWADGSEPEDDITFMVVKVTT
jgi:serine phosphatase RsbU (regulator of sigma subunit)